MKKKTLLLMLPAAVLLALVCIGGIYFAQASSAGDFNIVDGVLYSYSGNDESVVIPAEVRDVARDAFRGNAFISSLSFAGAPVTIGESAFRECPRLVSVVIPDSVTDIGDSAFESCPALNDVSIGKGLRRLGDAAFADCDSLAAVSISADNPNFAADGCSIVNKECTWMYQYLTGAGYRSYAVPEYITGMEPFTFWGADELEHLTVSGIKEIPDYSIANCENLKSVVLQIPTSRIGVKAFTADPSLVQVVMPISINNIHETAFDGCPENLYLICDLYSYTQRFADEHFYQTSASPVVNIIVENIPVVREDGNVAELPDASPAAGGNADGSSDGTDGSPDGQGSLRVSADGVVLGNSPIVSDRAYVQVHASDMTVHDGSAAPTPVPQSDVIADHAYYLDQTLTEYIFRPGTEEIGDFAFARTRLQKAELPEGLKSIGEGAFYHCDFLTDVTVPNSVTHVGKNAFTWTPWYSAWLNDENSVQGLVVGDGVLIGWKGDKPEELPENVKYVADGVFD